MNKIELTKEKSEQQAAIIRSIGVMILLLDVDYCRELVKRMYGQASQQEAMAVLMPRHSQTKNDSLRASATALDHLCDYVDALKECDRLKARIQAEEGMQDELSKLFL